MVHELPVQFLENHQEGKDFLVKTYGCIDQGSLDLKCVFPKNIFYNNEIVTGHMTYNNSKNALKISTSELTVL